MKAAMRRGRARMSLILEIEYLSGVSFAAIGPDSEAPDWPPQPDRIFSALVASWAARGEPEEERRALEWLEMRSVPRLFASEAAARTSVVAFVPPNDPRSDKQKNARGVLPALRSRQPRRFPAARPHDPVICLCWPDAEPDEAVLSALQALARDTAYIGHSASLTRCRFLLDRDVARGAATRPQRGVYQGRLDELRQAYRRFEKSADKKDRPQKGVRIPPAPAATAARTNLFGDENRWLILEHVAGDRPEVRACALVAKTLRATLLSGYRQIGREDNIPEMVSGHAADGTPTRTPHLAIVPLAFAGFPYADGHVMGFALVSPAGTKILARPGTEDTAETRTFRAVLRKLTTIDQAGRRILTLKSGAGTPRGRAFSTDLSLSFEPPGERSLDPALYTRPARTFATVTPIVLDRYLKQKGARRQDEAGEQIAAACRNIGLPEPKAVVVDKHSAVEGAPSAYPSGKAPRWMNWRLPPSLASRQLTHAVIRFSEPVDGPVILGAGRFVGLGLCRPLQGEGADADR
ncbi:MAG TPA: type I-U CRISPR-associated protein Csb2 [Stellaceae bacterium]|nr:type I-U CRISPR-associated protein Csb2 [Stellaceae bacterium]